MNIISCILAFGLLWTFWMLYEVVKHTQGVKIKAYWGRYMALQEAGRLEKKLYRHRIMKQLERNRVEDMEVEEVNPLEAWDVVFRGQRYPETLITEELVIIPND